MKLLTGEVTTVQAAAQAGVDRCTTIMMLRKAATDGAIAACRHPVLAGARRGRRPGSRSSSVV